MKIREILESIASIGILGAVLYLGMSDAEKQREHLRAHCYDSSIEMVGGRLIQVQRNDREGDWKALFGYDLDGKSDLDVIVVESFTGFQECPISRRAIYKEERDFAEYLSKLKSNSATHP